MGLPSGTLWAISDIDVTEENGFANTPFTHVKSYFSWGNIDGHNPTTVNSFSPWDWGNINASAPYYSDQVYGNTPGDSLNGNIPVGVDYDAARANLGENWRMPTNEEFNELFDNVIFINADGTEVDTEKTDKRVTVNGIVGIYIQSKINGARMFFSCSGRGYDDELGGRSANGYYWSSSWNNVRSAHAIRFYNGGVHTATYSADRFYGFPIRPVINASE